GRPTRGAPAHVKAQLPGGPRPGSFAWGRGAVVQEFLWKPWNSITTAFRLDRSGSSSLGLRVSCHLPNGPIGAYVLWAVRPATPSAGKPKLPSSVPWVWPVSLPGVKVSFSGSYDSPSGS